MTDDPIPPDWVKQALDRVLSWPAQRQEDAAEMLRLTEEHDKSPYGLNAEQAATEFGFFVDHFTFVAGLLFAAVHGPGRILAVKTGSIGRAQ